LLRVEASEPSRMAVLWAVILSFLLIAILLTLVARVPKSRITGLT
jgi:uncharacterized integral membrane protein